MVSGMVETNTPTNFYVDASFWHGTIHYNLNHILLSYLRLSYASRHILSFDRISYQCELSKKWAANMRDRLPIARRVLLGQANIDIAKDLGVTKEMVSMVRNSPCGERQAGLHASGA